MPCRLEGTLCVLGPGLATIWLNSSGKAGDEYLQSGTSVAFRRAGRRQSVDHLKGSAVMSAAATTTNTIRLHRVLRAAPERIYRAFLDADAMAKWLPPNGFTGKVHQMDARVGGTHR